MQFLSIYIREAHPIDGWWLGKPPFSWVFRFFEPRAATHVYDPKTIEERRAVAGECNAALQYGIRTVVDEMDDAVNLAYMGWPTRLYLVGLDGRVVYPGAVGPFGFRPKELETAIEQYLAEIE